MNYRCRFDTPVSADRDGKNTRPRGIVRDAKNHCQALDTFMRRVMNRYNLEKLWFQYSICVTEVETKISKWYTVSKVNTGYTCIAWEHDVCPIIH